MIKRKFKDLKHFTLAALTGLFVPHCHDAKVRLLAGPSQSLQANTLQSHLSIRSRRSLSKPTCLWDAGFKELRACTIKESWKSSNICNIYIRTSTGQKLMKQLSSNSSTPTRLEDVSFRLIFIFLVRLRQVVWRNEACAWSKPKLDPDVSYQATTQW